MLNKIFNVPNEKLEKLGLALKRVPVKKSNCFQAIFAEAKKRNNTEILSIDDITAGYYELYTVKHDLPLKTKKSITNLVGIHCGPVKNRILTRVGNGLYKLYEPEDDNNQKYINLFPKKRGYYRKKEQK